MPRKPPRVFPQGVRRPTAHPFHDSARLHFVLPPALRSDQTLPASPSSALATQVRRPARWALAPGSMPRQPAGTERVLRRCCLWLSPVALTLQIALLRLFLTHSLESILQKNTCSTPPADCKPAS